MPIRRCIAAQSGVYVLSACATPGESPAPPSTARELTAVADDGTETRDIVFTAGTVDPVTDPVSAPNPASSCEEPGWPKTAVSCAEAQDWVSLGMTSVSQTRIWLTTLAAVDAELSPPQQVADHPTDPTTPVWVFIYDGGRREQEDERDPQQEQNPHPPATARSV